MACVDIPSIPKPQLPSPLTIPIPSGDVGLSVGANLCCQIHVASPTLLEIYGALGGPPLPPGAVINLAVINGLLGFIDDINEYLDSLPIECPLDGGGVSVGG